MDTIDPKLKKIFKLLSNFMDLEKVKLELLAQIINSLTDEGEKHAKEMEADPEILERV